MRADRVQAVMLAQLVVERRQQSEAGLRSLHHRNRDGAVERDHWIGGCALEQLVEGEDLWPVGVSRARRFGVERGDRRLQLIRPELCSRQRVGDEREAVLYVRRVPEAPVLLGERDEAAVGAAARGTPRV